MLQDGRQSAAGQGQGEGTLAAAQALSELLSQLFPRGRRSKQHKANSERGRSTWFLLTQDLSQVNKPREWCKTSQAVSLSWSVNSKQHALGKTRAVLQEQQTSRTKHKTLKSSSERDLSASAR